MTPDAEGRQVVDVVDLRPGLWRIRLVWTVDGDDYDHEEILIR